MILMQWTDINDGIIPFVLLPGDIDLKVDWQRVWASLCLFFGEDLGQAQAVNGVHDGESLEGGTPLIGLK